MELFVAGISVAPKLFGRELPNFGSVDGPSSPLPFPNLPFGFFKVLYNDGELRIIRTGQNWVSVNERRQQPAPGTEVSYPK